MQPTKTLLMTTLSLLLAPAIAADEAGRNEGPLPALVDDAHAIASQGLADAFDLTNGVAEEEPFCGTTMWYRLASVRYVVDGEHDPHPYAPAYRANWLQQAEREYDPVAGECVYTGTTTCEIFVDDGLWIDGDGQIGYGGPVGNPSFHPPYLGGSAFYATSDGTATGQYRGTAVLSTEYRTCTNDALLMSFELADGRSLTVLGQV